MPSCSVIIPVYNSEESLRLLIEQLEVVLSSLMSPYEVVLVNDGSRDNSWDIITQLASEYEFIRGINLMRNYGQHNALLCGIRAASYEIIITMDDDLQNPPREIPKLLDKLYEGYDVVYGIPLHEKHGLWRDLASQLTKLSLQKAMGAEIARNISAFRAFKTKLREAFFNYQNSFVSVDVLLTWGTARFAAVPVLHEKRLYGKSNYTFGKLLTHAVNMITGFSVLPLQMASLIGFFFTLFGMGTLIYVIGRYLIQGGAPPGFPFLASIIAIFSGAQLFALGIMGEYLARMYSQSMGRPSSAIRERIGFKDAVK